MKPLALLRSLWAQSGPFCSGRFWARFCASLRNDQVETCGNGKQDIETLLVPRATPKLAGPSIQASPIVKAKRKKIKRKWNTTQKFHVLTRKSTLPCLTHLTHLTQLILSLTIVSLSDSAECRGKAGKAERRARLRLCSEAPAAIQASKKNEKRKVCSFICSFGSSELCCHVLSSCRVVLSSLRLRACLRALRRSLGSDIVMLRLTSLRHACKSAALFPGTKPL